MGELDGRVACVTGGTRGIGRAIAEALLREGASVVINGRSEEKGAAAIEEIGAGDKVLAYGKAGVVGVKGEIEHASAFIHTLRFGNKFRDAVGGTSYLSFTNTRGPAGCKISIPMMHKTDSGLRPYYLTHEFNIQDAPCPDEIVIAIGGSPGGRAHARTGDRYQDMKEMGIKNS